MNGLERARRGVRHLPMIAWLWLLWILLWGSVDLEVLLGGLAVALALVAAFPLPPALPRAVPRPLRIGALLVHLLTDLVRSGATAAWQALRHGPRTSAAIVEVELRVDSDLLITAVAELTTMTPGTLVAEIDRRRRLLYVHTLPVHDERDIHHRKSEVQMVERRVARAIGHGESFEGFDGIDGPSSRRKGG
ncbi:Na+/H+ antiporter subunit E [Streptomyces spinoverrucosus]|uniref:Na+/H+ antiporter subunit E n=1 Tax=Streptomyces spinoverrucosus TaxID=284043 RepID=A0A4Y3V776_9ACTN|nr:Na+/H+ antiporter subunit E [Streptomyces spinoverrucosus]GEC02674.1 Na+/H+ antiporter subunit E [Streptomyces spinoverrucosus]GHB41327.1 Na+/H+ antiporter subunit E [Streptomyces spinoverrucosus]